MLVGSQLRTKYDRLKWRLDDARAKTAEAKAVYDAAKAHETAIEAEFNEIRDALDAVLDAAVPPAAKSAVHVPQPQVSASVHVPAYIRELIEAFPSMETIDLERLREKMNGSGTSVNTRIQKAMKLGLVTREARGEYTLTDLGRSARGGRLKVVGQDG